MEEPKVLTFGSINIDEFFEVPHIVSSGETITSSKYCQRAGGKGANQSVALAKAGALIWHAGKIGRDGEWIKKYMNNHGVRVDHIIISEDQPTGRAFIQVSQKTRDNSIVLLPGTNHMISLDEARKILSQEFGVNDWVIMQNEIGQIGGEILKLCKEKDYLIVNKLEAVQLYKQISGFSSDEDISIQDLLTFISIKFKHIGIIVTLGSEGLYAWYRPEQKVFNLPAFKTKVLDTTGAAEDFLDALKEATVASGLAVSQLGAMESIPSFNDVQKSKIMFDI
ncbi:ribokinase [Rhizophagus irregularis DAOM 181602=DAOM 197198]|nr:ribokinase [Rhizophagus irregularis DAOM 181602=DAOM 197198]